MAALLLALTLNAAYLPSVDSNTPPRTVIVRVYGTRGAGGREMTIPEGAYWRRELLPEVGMFLLSSDGAEVRSWSEFQHGEEYVLFDGGGNGASTDDGSTDGSDGTADDADALGTPTVSIERLKP